MHMYLTVDNSEIIEYITSMLIILIHTIVWINKEIYGFSNASTLKYLLQILVLNLPVQIQIHSNSLDMD